MKKRKYDWGAGVVGLADRDDMPAELKRRRLSQQGRRQDPAEDEEGGCSATAPGREQLLSSLTDSGYVFSTMGKAWPRTKARWERLCPQDRGPMFEKKWGVIEGIDYNTFAPAFVW